MPKPVPILQSSCCDSFLIIFRIEVCPVLRLLFSERWSAQVLSDSDLVPDKTFKRYRAAKNHRIVPFKTFLRNGCGKISPAIPILRTPFHSADGLHRHRSLAVLYPCQCYSPALFRNSILAPEGFRMHRESGIELEGLSLFVKRFREEITNGSEQLSLACWCLLWDL